MRIEIEKAGNGWIAKTNGEVLVANTITKLFYILVAYIKRDSHKEVGTSKVEIRHQKGINS